MWRIGIVLGSLALASSATLAQDCAECHRDVTPQIVSDWELSLHAESGVSCEMCHGEGHRSADDVDKVQIPTPDTPPALSPCRGPPE